MGKVEVGDVSGVPDGLGLEVSSGLEDGSGVDVVIMSRGVVESDESDGLGDDSEVEASA